MKTNQYPLRSLIGTAVITIMCSQSAQAGAFSLYTESSAAAIGNYAAGVSAEAADASTAWYNPAGLVLLKKQELVFSGVGVFPSSKLTGTSTFATTDLPSYNQSFSGIQAAKNALVPVIHYALPLGDRAAFGLSIVSPFGLSTQYSVDSPVRYAATLSQLRVIDVSPDIAGKITDNFSVGLGLDFQSASVKFNAVEGVPTLLQHLGEPPTLWDSTSNNEGNSFAMGFHTGVMGVFNDDHTRVGLNYQSKMSHRFTGTSTLTGTLADPTLSFLNSSAVFTNDLLISNSITLPDLLTLSAYQDVNAKLALLGSVVYTGWSSFKTIQLDHVAAFTATGQAGVTSTSTEDYRDVWRVAIGANYHMTDKWMMRVGGGYDQTPTVDSARDVRLPDASRWALSIGSHYQFRPNLGVDVGYTYLCTTNNGIVNKTQALGTTSSYNVNALAKVNAQLVGAQLVWAIDQPARYVTK